MFATQMGGKGSVFSPAGSGSHSTRGGGAGSRGGGGHGGGTKG